VAHATLQLDETGVNGSSFHAQIGQFWHDERGSRPVQIPPRAQITHIIAPTQAAIPDLRFGPGQAFDPVLILRGALTGNHASPPTSAANIDAASACMPGMMC
jgi:hypothetical protein